MRMVSFIIVALLAWASWAIIVEVTKPKPEEPRDFLNPEIENLGNDYLSNELKKKYILSANIDAHREDILNRQNHEENMAIVGWIIIALVTLIGIIMKVPNQLATWFMIVIRTINKLMRKPVLLTRALSRLASNKVDEIIKKADKL